MKSIKRKKYLIWFFLIFILGIGSIMAYKFRSKIKYFIKSVYYNFVPSQKQAPNQNQVNTLKNAIALTEGNYGKEIDKLAEQFNIPASYLKALILLECAGKNPVSSRFEAHVYRELQRLQAGEISEYKGITTADIKNSSNHYLRDLASSWGPFQLMGYKCITLGITVNDIKGESALFWGVKWIDITYGNYLRKKEYKHAFHLHNTGKEFPDNGTALTHDPNYVDKGLKYMEYF